MKTIVLNCGCEIQLFNETSGRLSCPCSTHFGYQKVKFSGDEDNLYRVGYLSTETFRAFTSYDEANSLWTKGSGFGSSPGDTDWVIQIRTDERNDLWKNL